MKLPKSYQHPAVFGAVVFTFLLAATMFFFISNGYETSIGWELTTEVDFDELSAYQFQKGPFEFQIKGEKQH